MGPPSVLWVNPGSRQAAFRIHHPQVCLPSKKSGRKVFANDYRQHGEKVVAGAIREEFDTIIRGAIN